MASGFDNNQPAIEENFGPIALTELQKVFNDDTESSQSAELNHLPTKSDVSIDNIVFSSNIDNADNAIVDNDLVSSQTHRTINACIENFNLTEQRLLSAYDNANTSMISNGNTYPVSQDVSPTDELQSQDPVIPKNDSHPIQTSTERHIMISYNHKSSFDMCQKICLRLRDLGYRVWLDEDDLHGTIFEAMARAIENSYIVLICYNENYCKSDYCKKEATYTYEKHIDFIPCRLQTAYRPDGWLGIIISDKLYIDFSPSHDFDDSFKRLVNEIKHIEARSQIQSNPTLVLRSNNVPMNNEIMRDQFNAIIRDYKESINKTNYDLRQLEKEELCELIVRLRERLFNDISSTSDNTSEVKHLNNDELLHELFQQSRNQTELLRRITEILSKINDYKTIIKLSLAFIFLWTVKTLIIDACINYK